MINLIKDVDLFNKINNYDVILIGSNIYCLKGDGFQYRVSYKYPYVFEGNVRTKYADINKLGTMMECIKDNNPIFTLVYITKGYEKKIKGERNDFLRYDALISCLKQINERYKGKKIASPILGCSLFDGNGDKEKVLELMNEYLTDVNIDVYDFYQQSNKQIWYEKRLYERHVGDTDKKKFFQLRAKRIKEEKIMDKIHKEFDDNIII